MKKADKVKKIITICSLTVFLVLGCVCAVCMKLMGKETIVPDAAPKAVFLGAPVIGLISLFVTALLIPFAGLTPFYGIADIIVLIYLLTIPAVAIIIGGAASGSPFSGVGISREMVTIVSYELPLILVLLTVGKKAGMALTGGMTFSLIDISAYQAQNGMMITHWAMIPAAIAFLLIIPGEVGTQPFDVAEAETEICEGTMAEYSGAPLALFELSHSVKMFIMIDRFLEEMKTDATVVATGGLAGLIIPYCRHRILLDRELMLTGLLDIYEKNVKTGKR